MKIVGMPEPETLNLWDTRVGVVFSANIGGRTSVYLMADCVVVDLKNPHWVLRFNGHEDVSNYTPMTEFQHYPGAVVNLTPDPEK